MAENDDVTSSVKQKCFLILHRYYIIIWRKWFGEQERGRGRGKERERRRRKGRDQMPTEYDLHSNFSLYCILTPITRKIFSGTHPQIIMEENCRKKQKKKRRKTNSNKIYCFTYYVKTNTDTDTQTKRKQLSKQQMSMCLVIVVLACMLCTVKFLSLTLSRSIP